jgi:exodeoxyribonuclease VII small subunit
MSQKPNANLSKTLTELQSLVTFLEDENTELEDSLETFENGIELVRRAQSVLAQAEQRVQILTEGLDDPDGQEANGKNV